MNGLNSANSTNLDEIDYNELYLAIQSGETTSIEAMEIFYYNENGIYELYMVAHGTNATQIGKDLEKDGIKFCDADGEKYLACDEYIQNINSQNPGSVVEAVEGNVFSLVEDPDSF